jgi:hypothetical protein
VFGILIVYSLSMIIGDFNIECIPILESKAYTPLIVDPDRVLTLSVPVKLVKLVSGRRLEILQPRRYVNVVELSPCPPPDIRRKPSRPSGDVNLLGVSICKGLDHN